MTTTPWIRVARQEEIPHGQIRVFEAGEESIAICRTTTGALFAVEDVCTHDGGPLGEGVLDEYAIECPRHGARFDMRTGAVVCMPAVVPVRTFPVREEAGEVFVQVEG